MPSDTYHWLARYYDHLFDMHGQFDRARRAIIDPLLLDVRSVCDIACGTGTLALYFAGRNLKSYALDLSPEMCRNARLKARRAGLPLRVIEADMRDFRLPEKVDLVTCHFDALNHVPLKRDLHRVAKCVARALNPGGHFVFDVNTRLSFERVWNMTWFLEREPVVMVMQSGHTKGSGRAWGNVDWFVRTGKNCWRRHHEHVEEVCWTAAEIREALKRAGFGRFKTWDAAPLFKDALTHPGNRTFWRARLIGGKQL
jgi:SAM-dependent methyltransferase